MNKKSFFTPKHLLIMGTSAAVLISAVGYALYRQNELQTNPKTPEQKERANAVDPTIENSKTEAGIDRKAQKVEPVPTDAENKTSEQAPAPESIQVFISRVGQTEDKRTVLLRGTVSGTSSGTCSYTFGSTKDGSVIKRTNAVTPDATSSICSIDLPASEFMIDGEWKASLSVTDGPKTSNTFTQSFQVTK